jgi:hypothetical protein
LIPIDNEVLLAREAWFLNDGQNPWRMTQTDPIPVSPAPSDTLHGLLP